MTTIAFRTRHRPASRPSSAALGFTVCALLALPALATAQTSVTTAGGDVQGQINDGTREFLGIPYAAPPVGPLRFRPPQPAASWESPLVATTYPPSCAQLPTLTNSDTRVENEDCLYLNVWTPDPAPAEPLPVMFWIHGGSNTSGSTADFVPFPGYETSRLYDGHRMSKKGNVIVVTVNYRLNVFGFFGLADLASEDPSHPYAGNQGLLDQRAALQWVQQNIAAFGGDPANVTIYGESAGSFDVCAHVVSPMSTGLFHRAISQSGGCTVGVQSPEESLAAAAIITDAVGCGEAVDKLACLRGVPSAALLDAGPLVDLVGEGTSLSISVDGGFLTEYPIETFNRGELPKLPYMLGSNFDEGSLFFIDSPELTEAEYSAELVTQFGAYAPEIEALYPASVYETPRKALIRVFGDSALVCSTYDVARRYSAARNKTYAYSFARVPPLLFISFYDLGSFHGLEIGYVFGSAGEPTPMDATLGSQMQNYWSSFAAKGKPKADNGSRWPRFKNRSYKMMRLDTPVSVIKDFRRSKCDFWSSVYEAGGY